MNRTRCLSGTIHDPTTAWIFSYLYPATLLICLVGNCFNLYIYLQPLLKTSTTIRLLSAKAVANTMYMLSLIVQTLSNTNSLQLIQFTWLSHIYFVYAANTFGNTATWLTVAVTLESFVAVALPLRSASLSTMLNANICIAITVVISGALHVSLLFNRAIISCPCDSAKCVFTDWRTDNVTWFNRYMIYNVDDVHDTVYNWLSSCIGVMVPISLLLLLSIALRVVIARQRFETVSEQKSCVIRLTTATAICHLLLESPTAFVFLLTAVGRSSNQNLIGLVHPFANYLTMLNSSISFFVYYGCSNRFRQICMTHLCPCWTAEPSQHRIRWKRFSTFSRRSTLRDDVTLKTSLMPRNGSENGSSRPKDGMDTDRSRDEMDTVL